MGRITKSRVPAILGIVIALLVLGALAYGFRHMQQSRRGEKARPVDLTKQFNAQREDTWAGPQSAWKSLVHLRRGQHILGRVRFDVGDGLIQLRSRQFHGSNSEFPERVAGIPVQQECERIHLLHSTLFKIPDGTPVSMLVLHYADGREESLMINYGHHVRDWSPRYSPNTPPSPLKSPTTQMAWTGTNTLSLPGEFQRLFRTTFVNPRPRAAIKSVDYVSAMSTSAPFLVALSVD